MVLPSFALVVMAQVFYPPLGSPPLGSGLAPDVSYEPGPVSVAASPNASDPTFVAAWVDDRDGLPDTSTIWLERIDLDGGTRAFLGIPVAGARRIPQLKLATGPAGLGLAFGQIGALQRTYVNWYHVTPDGGVSALQTVPRPDPTGFDLAVVPRGVVVATGENVSGVAFSGAIVGTASRPNVSTTRAVAISPLPDGGVAWAYEGTGLAGSSVSYGVYQGALGFSSDVELLGLAPGLTRPAPQVLLQKPGEVARLDLDFVGAPVRVAGTEATFGTTALGHVVLVGPATLGGLTPTTLSWYATDGGEVHQPLFLSPAALATMGASVVVAGAQGDDVVAEWRSVENAGNRRVLNLGPAARRHPTVAWNGADFVATVEVRGATRNLWLGANGTPGVTGETVIVPATADLQLTMVQRTALAAGVSVDRPGGSELRELDGGASPLPGRLWAVADGLPTVFWGGPTIGQTSVEGAVTASLPIRPPRCVASVGSAHLFIGVDNGTLRVWQVAAQAPALELPPLGPWTGSDTRAVCTRPSFATNELLAAWADGPNVRVVVYDGSAFTIRENLTLAVPAPSQPVNPIAMRLGSGIAVAWELERGDDIGFGLVRDGGLQRVAQLLDPRQRAFGVGELSMASNPDGTRLAILWSAMDPRLRARVLGGRLVGLPTVTPDDGGVDGGGDDGGIIAIDAGIIEIDAGLTETDGGAVAVDGGALLDAGSTAGDAGLPDAGASTPLVERFSPECGCHAPGGLALFTLVLAFWRRRRSR